MVKKSGDMTFWPVTVRPPDQLALEVGEGKPYPMLQERLLDRYAGRELMFEEILNDDYPPRRVDGAELPLGARRAREGGSAARDNHA